MTSKRVLIAVCLLLLSAGACRAGVAGDAGDGNVEGVRRYLDGGGDPNPRLANGASLLETAIGWRRVEVVKLLFERGADPLPPRGNLGG